jgi:uncharacterized protein YhfF
MPEIIMAKYPGATAWAFGDSPAMADELAALVLCGIKTATCSAFSSYADDEPLPQIGQYSIILNGEGHPVCVIRTTALQLVRFNEMTPALAAMEGEGDLSLAYWQQGHREFFTREGSFDEQMELVVEIFERVEVL